MVNFSFCAEIFVCCIKDVTNILGCTDHFHRTMAKNQRIDKIRELVY